ncbi:MAG: NADH-quinone oxidoreductase subunit NuoF [Thermodesulfovibrionales bacterium]
MKTKLTSGLETLYPSKASLVMPLLHLLQKRDGYISESGIIEISNATGLSLAFIRGVYTFYSFYNSRPPARYLIQICRNVACMAMGADILIEHLVKNHGFKEIEHGIFSYGPEPSAINLMITECIGACGIGPAMLVNDTLIGRLNREKIDGILKDLLQARSPEPEDHLIDAFPMKLESYLLRTLDCTTLDSYKAKGGYEAFKKALGMKPEQVIDIIKGSGLRGRGGAGFPTGMKWAFARQDPKTPKYLIINADEGEPGTYKDRILLSRNPHQIIEGMLIGSYAIGASLGWVYLRYEYPEVIPVLEGAIKEVRQEGLLGKNILGSDFSFDIVVHRGAGAYICGEETALIESIEGSRGQPRIRPPFPVNSGYNGKPTVINNVETIANIPVILNLGPENYSKIGSRDAPGPKLFSISGVKKPGVYELPSGITLKEILEIAGGPVSGTIKAIIPGGLSTPVLTKEMLDCPMDFTGPQRYKSMLGTGGLMVFGEDICMVRLAMRAMSFYRHESCGKCTPCREGTGWLENILKRIEEGRASEEDISLLKKVSNNISGKTFCALGDAAACVIGGILRNFEEEFKDHIRQGGCPLKGVKG